MKTNHFLVVEFLIYIFLVVLNVMEGLGCS
jgi:hypothetical protein